MIKAPTDLWKLNKVQCILNDLRCHINIIALGYNFGEFEILETLNLYIAGPEVIQAHSNCFPLTQHMTLFHYFMCYNKIYQNMVKTGLVTLA